jgi:hypothetical protein
VAAGRAGRRPTLRQEPPLLTTAPSWCRCWRP